MPRKKSNSTFSRKYRGGHHRMTKTGKYVFVRGTIVTRRRKKR